jgi:primosomal protein N' (replication factor Y)
MGLFVDVVAFVTGDPKKSTFTYSIPPEIPLISKKSSGDVFGELVVGQLVEIPYGKKKVEGITVRIHDEAPDFATKPINGLLYPDIVLPEYLLKTAQWMSTYYHEPLRNCVAAVTIFEKQVRLPKEKEGKGVAQPLVSLHPEQRVAFDAMMQSVSQATTFLLHGITGSGKTEIYLHLIAELIRDNKQVIYLVPEIALTPQTIRRVEEKFPGDTVVLNSQISDGQRYSAFLQCMSGTKHVVIGSRSALFAPLPHLGAIIIDEEHDHSYKQESSPHYHAVMTAEYISSLLSIPLVLGSATPRVDDYYRASARDEERAVYHIQPLTLLSLSTRALDAVLPPVKIVDMREELKKRNFTTLSDSLEEALGRALEKHEQSLLFLNKRGVASSLLCRMCGWTAECPRCSVALTMHKDLFGVLTNMLLCHHCDYQMKVPHKCPQCDSLYIKTLGSGTERVEADVHKLLPTARVLRMDRDTTTHKGSHEEIYTKFMNHEADILIGTQMITKGWDIANVTLVGIVNADTALHMPHYKAAESIFSLITQVAGRAGRAGKAGHVILQTYNPDHYAVIAASNHAYSEFYDQEIVFRKQLMYPPFSSIVQLTFSDLNQEKAEYKAMVLFKQLYAAAIDVNVEVLGPTTGIIPKLRNKWYYQIILQGEKSQLDSLLTLVPAVWVIDVDPES